MLRRVQRIVIPKGKGAHGRTQTGTDSHGRRCPCKSVGVRDCPLVSARVRYGPCPACNKPLKNRTGAAILEAQTWRQYRHETILGKG